MITNRGAPCLENPRKCCYIIPFASQILTIELAGTARFNLELYSCLQLMTSSSRTNYMNDGNHIIIAHGSKIVLFFSHKILCAGTWR